MKYSIHVLIEVCRYRFITSILYLTQRSLIKFLKGVYVADNQRNPTYEVVALCEHSELPRVFSCEHHEMSLHERKLMKFKNGNWDDST